MRKTSPIVAFLLTLPLAGCMSAGVYGDGPVRGCGTPTDPASANLGGVDASWLGVQFQANGDAQVWLEATKSDQQFWSQRAIEGWALLVIDPDAPANEMVRNGRGGLGRYNELGTTVRVGSTGPNLFNEPAKAAGESLELMEHVSVAKGARVLVYAASTQSVPNIDLVVRWTGCGQTGEVVGGPKPGYAAGWDDFNATLLASNVRLGAVAYEARFQRPTDEGILIAMQPPAGSQQVYGKASLTTSQGPQELGARPRFYVHAGGPVTVDATFVGGGDSAKGPLLAYFPVPLHVLAGPYHRSNNTWVTGGDNP
jgi:hypothetical protein